MQEWGYCMSPSVWDRVDWSVQSEFFWRDKAKRGR